MFRSGLHSLTRIKSLSPRGRYDPRYATKIEQNTNERLNDIFLLKNHFYLYSYLFPSITRIAASLLRLERTLEFYPHCSRMLNPNCNPLHRLTVARPYVG